MKNPYILLLAIITITSIFLIIDRSYGATVGNPLDLDIPPKSSILRQEAVDEALDEYEEVVKIKAALDLEFVFDKDLHSTSEVTKAEVKGQWFMAKLGVDIFNRVEPYVKFGLSDLEAKWRQNNTDDIDVQADKGFAWGLGIKGIILELEEMGLRLTADAQYRITEPGVYEITRAGNSVIDSGADFKVEEWQAALVLSKKFELPLRWQNSIYIVPYTGLTVSESTVDVKFTDPAAHGLDLNIFEANNKSLYGFLIGCDIMPSLTSSFIYSVELRLASEIALTLGGAMKF